MKRLFDIVISSLMLVALAPILLIIALFVWIDEPGPVIYRGTRIGHKGGLFSILKFRSMTCTQTFTREITVCNDPRVTRVGRVLRSTKLDELPQLVNVLRGDMSLVGPRPESPYFVSYYTPQQREVLSVRPGITGASQLLYHQEEQLLTEADPEKQYLSIIMPAKLTIDLEYVKRHSFWLDLKLLSLTVIALIRPVSHVVLPNTKQGFNAVNTSTLIGEE